MTYSNSQMRKLLERNGDAIKPEYLVMADKQIDKLFKDLKLENGCLFLASHNGRTNAENVTDKTAFEASQNEVLLNRLFPKKNVTAALAPVFYGAFNARLQDGFARKFCSVLSEDDGRWTYRFHIVRENEPLWISEDIERFTQPVMYDVF